MTRWNANACPREIGVIRCARTGFWDAELQHHVTDCRACAEAAAVARLLNDLRSADEATARIPDGGLMWRKAQFLAARDASERATQPIGFVERFAYAVAIVCVIGVCVWQWQAIRGWFTALGSGGANSAFAWMSGVFAHFWTAIDVSRLGAISAESPAVFIAGGVGLLALCAFLASYLVHSEE